MALGQGGQMAVEHTEEIRRARPRWVKSSECQRQLRLDSRIDARDSPSDAGSLSPRNGCCRLRSGSVVAVPDSGTTKPADKHAPIARGSSGVSRQPDRELTVLADLAVHDEAAAMLLRDRQTKAGSLAGWFGLTSTWDREPKGNRD